MLGFEFDPQAWLACSFVISEIQLQKQQGILADDKIVHGTLNLLISLLPISMCIHIYIGLRHGDIGKCRECKVMYISPTSGPPPIPDVLSSTLSLPKLILALWIFQENSGVIHGAPCLQKGAITPELSASQNTDSAFVSVYSCF